MPSTRTINYDICISYAHLDDYIPVGEERGWIDLLHERLRVLLTQVLGYEPNIWRDGHNLQGNDVLAEAFSVGVSQSLLFVPVISPRYVQSEWCRQEMEAFHASEPPDAASDFRSRVFKVEKTPLPDHLEKHEPEHIRNLIGYQFYAQDGSGLITEFSPDPTDKQYWRMLNRLVADIANTLTELKHPQTLAPKAHDVFISYSSKDVERAREVRTALENAGIECWMADDDILPSEIFGKAIIKAINSSRLVLLVFTANANSSKHVESEIDRAYNKQKPIILLRIEEIDLSESLEYYLSTGSWLNASEPPLNRHLPTLIEKVKLLFSYQSPVV